ncbi:DUF1415 domain-containing protein [Halioxenophilus sp. WMMB6]|uniref:DUF1415 domain-containing protein n=1 Tax=Halioxenophilus sp. WMMB6 TaxID=3073815 RepID=UPI00295E5196|nr:DUF1415 domain-containing protein [Halioxenophilus sp. WMMB6]
MTDVNEVLAASKVWLQQVVIGLGLCPFAASPWREGRVEIVVSEAVEPDVILTEVVQQLRRLEATPAAELETTLLVVANGFADFDDYNQFLDVVDALLEAYHWQGIFQVASFHPDYQFAGEAPQARSNLTNCAPYPIFHLLREQSISAVAEQVDDLEAIPERNIAKLEAMPLVQLQGLFPYIKWLFGA